VTCQKVYQHQLQQDFLAGTQEDNKKKMSCMLLCLAFKSLTKIRSVLACNNNIFITIVCHMHYIQSNSIRFVIKIGEIYRVHICRHKTGR